MFPFTKKKIPAVPVPAPNDAHDRANRKLDETCDRLDDVLKEMRRRLEEKHRKALTAGAR